jgi:hypothetical protein
MTDYYNVVLTGEQGSVYCNVVRFSLLYNKKIGKKGE